MDFSVSLLQLIEQGEFLWTTLSSPHLYSSKCLQSTRAGGAQTQGISNWGWPKGRRELPALSVGVKCAHPSMPFPEPVSQQTLHRDHFTPGTEQIGFVTLLGAVQGHSPCSHPGHSYESAGAGTHSCLGAQ